MNTMNDWPAPTPPRVAPAGMPVWGKLAVLFGSIFTVAVLVGTAVQGNDSPKGGSSGSSGGNFYAAPGWTIDRAADLSVKIQYDGGASSARADCAMKTIVGHISWLEWQAMGSSQVTAISVAEEGC